MFCFPLPANAAFSDFEAKCGDIFVKGVVKEKEQARAEFKKAVEEENQTAALGEINRDTGDIFVARLGNIPPKCDIDISFTLTHQLALHLNKEWELRIPAALSARYCPDI